MKGWRIVEINSMEDLKKADYDWALEQCGVSLDEVIGCYVIIGAYPENFTPNIEGPLKLPATTHVTIITNVDVRLFWEMAVAFKVGNDELWITEEEMERVTT